MNFFIWLHFNQCTEFLKTINFQFLSSKNKLSVHWGSCSTSAYAKQFLLSSPFAMGVRPPPIHQGKPSCAPTGPLHRGLSPSNPPLLHNFCLQTQINNKSHDKLKTLMFTNTQCFSYFTTNHIDFGTLLVPYTFILKLSVNVIAFILFHIFIVYVNGNNTVLLLTNKRHK